MSPLNRLFETVLIADAVASFTAPAFSFVLDKNRIFAEFSLAFEAQSFQLAPLDAVEPADAHDSGRLIDLLPRRAYHPTPKLDGSSMIGQVIAQYKILARLGTGGMGVVYLAQDARLGRRVALKVLPAEFARHEDRVARFEREARAVAALSHPGIAVLYEVGEVDSTHYLAMEYVEGRNLQEQLGAEPMGMDRLIDYSVQIAEALEHAHRKGILHRDIKPANIMVTPEGRVKLLDFGLAKLVQTTEETRTGLTAPNTWMGTLHYCSAEVLRGREADPRSDLYSLGVVIYQMACGKLPFEGLHGHALVGAILTGQPQPANSANPLISPALHHLIMRAIAADPEERPQNATELCRCLREAVAGTAPHSAVTQTVPVLAVLEFQNIAEDRSIDWLGTGLAETLTTDLKRLKLVRVIGRERVQEAARRHRPADAAHSQLMELGKELRARWLVMGSFQRVGTRLRILPRVLEVATGEEIFTPKVDGNWDEVFALQDRVVTDVLAALEVRVDSSGMERIAQPETLHLEAYEQYAQGRQQFNQMGKESLELARQHLERAIALDPGYAVAYAALGATHAMRYIHRTDPAELDRSARCSERAIELDSELGEPHMWLCYVYMRQGKIEQSLVAGKKGVGLQPDLPQAHYFLAAAYWATVQRDPAAYPPAVKHFLDATVTDARWSPSWMCLGQIATMCGEYDRAEEFLLTGLERELRGPGFGYFIGFQMLLGTVALHRGDMDKAMELYAASTATLAACDHVYRESFLALTACGLGDVLLRTDNIEAALTEFRRASRLVKEFPRMLGRQRVSIRALAGLAAIHATQGDNVRAREFLAEATQIVGEVISLPHTWLWEGMPGQLYYALGTANTRLGEEKLALDFLTEAIGAGWRDAPFLASDSELSGLRPQSRFQALQKQLQDLPALDFQASRSISAHSGIALKR